MYDWFKNGRDVLLFNNRKKSYRSFQLNLKCFPVLWLHFELPLTPFPKMRYRSFENLWFGYLNIDGWFNNNILGKQWYTLFFYFINCKEYITISFNLWEHKN